MITNLSPSDELFLANMDRVQRQVALAGQQSSSGKRVNAAADAPDQIGAILQLRTNMGQNTQMQTNLGLAKTDANAADDALSSAAKLMDRAVTLAAQGANFTLDAAGRQSLALEVQSLHDQMLAISRTTVQGRFIFSGDQDGAPAYTADTTQPNGVQRLSTAAATRQVQDPAGGSFPVAMTAQAIFDSRNPDDSLASGNVFAALKGLNAALQANNTDQINAAAGALHLASAHLNNAQTFYGTVENRIQDALNYAGSYDVQLKTELSQKEDADMASAALALNQGTIQLQSAFQMQAKMPKTTLFDFLA